MFYAKKSLGQNFLNSDTILERIIEAAEISKKDTILEIGPGTGSLTAMLLERAGKVICIEKDHRLIPILTEKFKQFSENNTFELTEGDIKTFNPATAELKPGEYKIVANIPYYLTGLIFRKFLESDCQPSDIVLLVQKEVAERIIARDGKESILSISVKAFGDPKYICTVSKSFFKPQPNVDSAVIKISKLSKNNFKDVSEKVFFEILKAGFSSKRKILVGNLSKIAKKEKILAIFSKLNIDPKTRAENLNTNQWIDLTKILFAR